MPAPARQPVPQPNVTRPARLTAVAASRFAPRLPQEPAKQPPSNAAPKVIAIMEKMIVSLENRIALAIPETTWLAAARQININK